MIARATVCFNCGRELAGGIPPSRFGVCAGEEIFTLHAERFIREHNAAIDSIDSSPPREAACTDSGPLAPSRGPLPGHFASGPQLQDVTR